MAQIVEQTISVPFAKKQCFHASLDIIKSAPEFELTDSSEATGAIHATGKFSGVGYGEYVTIIVAASGNETTITVSSSPKAPYLLWRGKNEKNVNIIFSRLDEAFENMPAPKIKPVSSESSDNSSVESRIIKLDFLKKKGLITEKEYNQKRSEILNSI